jgi:sterol 3beta-glucosyltransferase
MPKLLIVATGTDGDIAPMVAITQTLSSRYSVAVMTHRQYLGRFEQAGAAGALVDLPHEPSEIFASLNGQRCMEGGAAGLRRLIGFYGLVKDYAPGMLLAFRAGIAKGEADVVLTSGPTPGVERLALAEGLPVRRIQFQPTWPSPDVGSLYISRLQPRFPGSRRIRNLAVSLGGEPLLRAGLLGSSVPTGLHPQLDESFHLGLTTWFAFPSLLGTRATRSSPAKHIGFIPTSDQYFESANGECVEVRATLESAKRGGRRVLFVGFGSMRTALARRHAELVVRAAVRLGYFVAHQGEQISGFPTRGEREQYVRVGALPHRQIFPLVDAVVCHGGINTCAAALGSAKPLILAPQWLDQFYWASRLQELSLAIATKRPLRRLTEAFALLQAFETSEFASPVQALRETPGLAAVESGIAEMLGVRNG